MRYQIHRKSKFSSVRTRVAFVRNLTPVNENEVVRDSECSYRHGFMRTRRYMRLLNGGY